MIKKAILCFSLLAITFYSYSQAPKYSNEFLSIGVGARAMGMGNAQTAICNDATSAFWNPAGLTRIDSDKQISLMHAEYFAGIAKYDYGTFAAPIDATRTVAFSVIRFAVDDIIDSTELIDANGNIDYDRLKTFSVADYAFLISYAQTTKKEGLRVGGNAKIIHRKAGDFAKAWGFGIDLGAQYDKGKWQFGLMGKDITGTFNAWSFNTEDLEEVFAQTGNEIPQNGLEVTLPKLIASAAYVGKINEKFGWKAVADLDITFDGKRNVLVKSDPVSVDPHAGIEIDYRDFIFLRGGVNNIQKVLEIDNSESTVSQPNIGLGVKIKNITLDYALTNIGSDVKLYSNIFSLKWNIYKKEKN
ncbi:MAG TPA: PorV/PorQ family protein [Bacteroidia bacterium]|nr:PorV/PorQ family protein [Bacteroidia bacterium]HNT80020.1 PorV/PorQ family protein [Bacteroidia bacterium]